LPNSHLDLTSLAAKHGTDKLAHGYLPTYEELLRKRRNEALALLEIGVGGPAGPSLGGASLRMWRDYLPNAHICAIDIHDKAGLEEDRITIRRGRQEDCTFLSQFAEEFGPFDLIIDDGSHINGHIVRSFRCLFPHLSVNGYYVVEDVQTSYWPVYGGSRRLRSRRSAMAQFKKLADHVNFSEFELPRYAPSEFDRTIEEVRFRHGMVIVKKGSNDVASAELPPHPRTWRWFLRRQTPKAVLSSCIRVFRPCYSRRGGGLTSQ
jgi:hypothetical protein